MIPVPIPPLPEQRRIVGILDEAFAAIATAKANAEKNLQNARELAGSLLEAVFTNDENGRERNKLVALCVPNRVITYGVIKLGEHVEDGVPCLRTSNVRWLRIDTDGMKRIAPALSGEFRRTILQGGEVLVNVRGTLGGVAVAQPEMVGWNVSREVAVVPVDATKINPQYAAYWIGTTGSQQWLTGVLKGAAYTGINIEDLRELPVRVPPLKEQQQLVRRADASLSDARQLASLCDRKLAALDALKKAVLQQAFSGRLSTEVNVRAYPQDLAASEV